MQEQGMRRRVRAVTLVFIAAILITPVIAGSAFAAAEYQEGGNDTAASDADGYTVSELQRVGNHPAESPTSMRPHGDAGSFWIRHVPRGVFTDPESESRRKYISPDTTVNRDHIYLGSFRGWESETMHATVRIVSWSVTEETREENGTAETVRVPTNIKEKSVNVTLDGGTYDEARVNLPPSYNETQYVTLWVEGNRETTQWVFRHKSSEAGKSINVAGKGDAVKLAAGWVFFPMLLTSVAMVAFDRYVLKKAAKGPDVGMLEYAFFAAASLFLGAFVFYRGVVDTLASAPYLLGVFGGLFTGMLGIWAFSDKGEKALFLQFRGENADIADDGTGSLHVANRVHTVVERKRDGKKVVPRTGWLPFIARAWPFYDAAPILAFDAADERHRKLESPPDYPADDADDETGVFDRIRSRFAGNSSDDEYDTVYLIDPLADDVIQHEKETFTFELPTVISWPGDKESGIWVRDVPIPSVAFGKILGGIAVVCLSYYVGKAFMASAGWGMVIAFLTVLALVSRPVEGKARATLAPAHYDAVIANMIQHLEGYSERADADHFQQKYHESEAKRRAARKEERERKDHNVFRQLADEIAPADDGPGESEAPADD